MKPAKAPFLLITPAFIVGILLYVYSRPPITLTVMLTASLFCASIVVFRRKQFFTFWTFFLLLIVGLGIISTHFKTPEAFSNNVSKQTEISAFKGIINTIPVSKQKTYSTQVIVSAVKTKSGWKKASGSILAYIDKKIQSPTIGDELLVLANPNPIQPPGNPCEFDFKQYLSYKGIYNQCYIPADKAIIISNNNSIRRLAQQCRLHFENAIESCISKHRESSIAKAMILGSRDDLSEETIHAFSNTGSMHVLAVSGLHVGIIFLFVQFLLKLAPNTKKWKTVSLIITLLTIWSYAFLTGLSASVLRSATMFSVIGVGNSLKRLVNTLNNLAFTAFIMLLIAPYAIMEVGFQLSFSAVMGIVYLQPKLSKLYTPKSKVIKPIWDITTVSFAAQIATFPLSILYFHQFPLLFPISNLLVIPAAFLVVILGVLFFIFHQVPIIGELIALFVEKILWLMNELIFFIDSTPNTLLQGIDISIIETWLIYAFIAAVCLYLWENRKWGLRIALLSIISLCTINLSESIYLQNENALIVYKVNKHTAIDFVDSGNHLFLSDSSLLSDERSLQFHIKHYWWKHNLNETNKQRIPSGLQIIDWKAHHVAVAQTQKEVQKALINSIIPDIMIISRNAIKDLSVLKDNRQTAFVFDSSNSIKNSKKLRKQNETLGLNCHFVNLDNAYVLNE